MIDLSSKIQGPLPRHLYKVAAPVIERGLAIRDFNDLCERTRKGYKIHPDYPSAKAWFSTAATELQANYEADLPSHFSIPEEGPLVIVSNHPFGLLDPVILGDFISRFRPYVRFMTNFLLSAMEDMRPWIIAVDPFNGSKSTQNNLGPIKEALRFLKEGGALAIFPSGEVAHYKMGRGVEESPWSQHVGGLVRRTKASVLPVYFPGQNGMLFQTAGLVHPMLRTGLLLRELFQKSRETVEMRVGQVIPFSRLRKFEDDVSLTRFLRLHTFVLSQRTKSVVKTQDLPAAEEPPVTAKAAAVVFREPVAAAPLIDTAQIENDIEKLKGTEALVATQGHMSVFIAPAKDIPNVLIEIGRLREIAFREVGEGTGMQVDVDKFDEYYLHAFLWDAQARRIAGAYRLGRADVILRDHGPKGLYTSSLFRFQKPFLAHLHDAVELGRSFIAPQYQRSLSTLPILWRGITTWVCRNPHYTKLFGPVSISKDYGGLSRKLIVEFLRDNRLHPDLATLVKPRNPFRYLQNSKLLREFISAELTNVDDFSALISCIEEDGKGIPTLLKHYLRLNGTILSFNVDESFSSCLDGLIMVDLTDTDCKLMKKYMGEEPCRKYMALHGVPCD